jgi:hypothetical protein
VNTYMIKFIDINGTGHVGPYNDRDQAERAFDAYAKYYRFVTLTETETVTNETTLRESTQ